MYERVVTGSLSVPTMWIEGILANCGTKDDCFFTDLVCCVLRINFLVSYYGICNKHS